MRRACTTRSCIATAGWGAVRTSGSTATCHCVTTIPPTRAVGGTRGAGAAAAHGRSGEHRRSDNAANRDSESGTWGPCTDISPPRRRRCCQEHNVLRPSLHAAHADADRVAHGRLAADEHVAHRAHRDGDDELAEGREHRGEVLTADGVATLLADARVEEIAGAQDFGGGTEAADAVDDVAHELEEDEREGVTFLDGYGVTDEAVADLHERERRPIHDAEQAHDVLHRLDGGAALLQMAQLDSEIVEARVVEEGEVVVVHDVLVVPAQQGGLNVLVVAYADEARRDGENDAALPRDGALDNSISTEARNGLEALEHCCCGSRRNRRRRRWGERGTDAVPKRNTLNRRPQVGPRSR